MKEDQIKHMVDRFLGWKLPENFNPDGGVSFPKKMFNEHTTPHPMKYEPIGTNLLDAEQATAMVRHMIEGMPQAGLSDTHPKWIVDRVTAELFERQADGSYRVAYKILTTTTCSTCGGKKRVAASNPSRAKAWEVPCPDCK